MMENQQRAATISVAMCTYNGERHLREQLESISAQTRLPLELVVCDDRSTDNTLQILRAFAESAPFPVRIHENSTQLRSTRNFDKATRLCHGEYIALCDQDDRWEPAKLAELGAAMDEDTGIGVMFSDARLINEASQLTGDWLWTSLRFPEEVRRHFLKHPGTVLLQRPVTTGATMLFRSALLEKYAQIPNTWVHDGWITWMSVFWMRPAFRATPLTQYRIHAAQQLGVGKTTLFSRLQAIRQNQRKIYANAAVEFQDLLAYVRATPVLIPTWAARLEEAIYFFKARANAPEGALARTVFLVRHRKDYRRFYGALSRPWIRDFLMQGSWKR